MGHLWIKASSKLTLTSMYHGKLLTITQNIDKLGRSIVFSPEQSDGVTVGIIKDQCILQTLSVWRYTVNLCNLIITVVPFPRQPAS